MDDELQANYIAIKTLKERCDQLQKRLDSLEEENLRLKLEKLQDTNAKNNFSTISNNNYEKQINLLNHQKSQMSHRIQLISNENQMLWSQLLKHFPEGMLSPKFSLDDKTYTESGPMTSSNIMLDNGGKESLEEISFKLINGILMSKIELENQYSEMIDLQKENVPNDIKKFSFTSKQHDCRTAFNCLKTYLQQLKDFKQTLNQQKIELSKAISFMKNHKCLNKSSTSSDSSAVINNKIESANETKNFHDVRLPGDGEAYNKVCPICETAFDGTFTELYQHVCDHFDDENEEFVDASANFEILP